MSYSIIQSYLFIFRRPMIYWMLITKCRLHYFLFPNSPGQVNICSCISYSVYSCAEIRNAESMVIHTRVNSILFSQSFFDQAILPVGKVHHVLWSGFIIKWVISYKYSLQERVTLQLSPRGNWVRFEFREIYNTYNMT